MLEKFRQAKMAEIRQLEREGIPAAYSGARPDFRSAISSGNRINIIAEYKRASPSLGVIRSDMEVEEVAKQYAEAGCAALSVLTEKDFFDGNIEYLERAARTAGQTMPILRKDFIFNPVQITATAAMPASALLLITRMFANYRDLLKLREYAESFGIEAVVEIFDADDLKMARTAGARIIQVNARDLQTLRVDRENCLRLIGAHPPQDNEIWIAASGIQAPEHLASAYDAGYHAALIGSSLMRQKNPGAALRKLIVDQTA